MIGNPAHDLIRLALSLASAARGSNLPGVTTARMLEAIIEGYEAAFERDFDETDGELPQPEAVRVVMREAASRTWKELAKDRIEDTRPTIPLGKRFWGVSKHEERQIEALMADPDIARLATMLKSRADDAEVEVVDAAYWMKGCSSLGRLRYAVLVSVVDKASKTKEFCLMDIKEAAPAAAPSYPDVDIPSDDAERVVEGSRHLAPFLGERTRAARLLDRSVFIRELLPQDLKVEIESLTTKEATRAAMFLASVVGFAHARQMDAATRKAWQTELTRNRSHSLDAPSWLWSSVVELLVSHEGSYLEHCRRYALVPVASSSTLRRAAPIGGNGESRHVGDFHLECAGRGPRGGNLRVPARQATQDLRATPTVAPAVPHVRGDARQARQPWPSATTSRRRTITGARSTNSTGRQRRKRRSRHDRAGARSRPPTGARGRVRGCVF